MEIRFVRLSENPEFLDAMANWFSARWGIPREAYAESMTACVRDPGFVPEWYAALDGERMVAGMGVIDNDFHDRTDLTPNVCAVFTDPDYRGRGLAGALLKRVASDAKGAGIGEIYLSTDHTSLYERYGWRFFCMANEDNGQPTRIYRFETAEE